ncbi:MAG: hypothetical protein SF051_09425, partial [Elusimicrobiota bacterium]|nr:hypothetical protein [Elusimicrobiota bacterium]
VAAADDGVLTRVYAAAGMTRAAAAAPAESEAGAALRAAMPDPRFTAVERAVIAAALTPEALAEVVAGRSTLDLKREALDAASLSVSDQRDEAVVAALAAKAHYKEGAMAAVRAAVPAADLSRFVCAPLDAGPSAAPAGESAAMRQLHSAHGRAHGAVDAPTAEAASAEADTDVIRVETVAYPGVAGYCRETAALRRPPAPAPASELPVTPAQSLPSREVPSLSGTAAAPGGPAEEGGGLGGRARGSLLGGLLGGVAGLGMAVALGGGPAGLLIVGGGIILGLALGGLFGKDEA